MSDTFDVETLLAAERPRLVRLCARLSGNWDTAEDLAQETLFQAWRYADRLQTWDQATPWLSGIARNVCLHWSRRYYREQAQLAQPTDKDWQEIVGGIEQLGDHFDFECELERHELATLLDRALALLPPETRTLLVQKYIEESPHAEIAACLGLSENAVAVRIHRGKLAFRRILANELRGEAADYGLFDPTRDIWEETRIWCPLCGQRRLYGRFQQGLSTGVFELYCPACGNGVTGTRADLSLPFFAELLGNIKTYKPAYTRLLQAMGNYYQQAFIDRSTPCLACGYETEIWVGPHKNPTPDEGNQYEARIRCNVCGWETNNSLGSFALIRSEVQRFWRAHPRLQTLSTQEVDNDGVPALVTRFRSVTAMAGLDVVAVRDTFEIVGVYPVHS